MKRIGIQYQVVIAVLALYISLMLLAPFQPVPVPTGLPSDITFGIPVTNGTYVTAKGYSPYDAYDRIINVMDNGVEVARIISPLHRDAALPNHFFQLLALPYPLQDKLTYQVKDTVQVWNVTFTTISRTNISNLAIEGIIPISMVNANAQSTASFTIKHSGETVYFLVSAHSLLEGIDNLFIQIDGKSYTVFNWHPLDNDNTLTSVGYVIPYIKVNAGLGNHTITITGSASLQASTPYMIVSGFGVYTAAPLSDGKGGGF